MTTDPDSFPEPTEDQSPVEDRSALQRSADSEASQLPDAPAPKEQSELPAPDPTTVFERQMLTPTIRWVWLGGYLIPTVVLTAMVFPFDLIILETPTGVVTAAVLIVLAGFAVWRTITSYRNWSWELDRTELIIERGVVFKLTRVVPRVRVQHVDITSGPLDRFFGLRQIKIYTAGTREADATIPGLTAPTAESLRQALIRR